MQELNILRDCGHEDPSLMIDLNDYDLVPVNSVEARSFSGKVFTFEVKDKARYFANGYLVGNCRCGFDPVFSYEDFLPGEQEPLKISLVTVKEKRGEVGIPKEHEKAARAYLKNFPLKKPVKYVANIIDQSNFLNFVKKKLGLEGDKADEFIRENEGIVRFETPKTVFVSTKLNQAGPPSYTLGRETGLDKWRTLNLEQKQEISSMWGKAAFKEKDREGTVEIEGKGYLDNLSQKNAKFFFAQSYAYYVSNPSKLMSYDRDLYNWMKSNVFNGREYITRGGV